MSLRQANPDSPARGIQGSLLLPGWGLVWGKHGDNAAVLTAAMIRRAEVHVVEHTDIV